MRFYIHEKQSNFIRSSIVKNTCKTDIKKKLDKINNFHLKTKDEIIFFMLHIYIVLFEERYSGDIKDSGYSFEILKKQGRIIVFLKDKYFSVHLPFNIIFDEFDKISDVKTREEKISIDIHVLRILKIFWGKLIVEENLEKTILNYIATVEDIHGEYVRDNKCNCNFDDVEKALFELLEYDSSYIRFDIDYEREKYYTHPLFHFDTDYRDYISYKIGLDRKIDEKKFLDLLAKETDCQFIYIDKKPPKRNN